jgi:hypothetical protein
MEKVMPGRYRHTQRGTLMLVVLGLGAAVAGTGAIMNPTAGRWLGLAIALGCIVLAWLFSSLTVIVNGGELEWYFGPGAWKYRMALKDIAGVNIVRNNVLNGFGIRMRPGFRLYNVSGLDAVELHLKSGEIRRIGTDDAPGLATVLRGE